MLSSVLTSVHCSIASTLCRSLNTTGKATKLGPASCCSPLTARLSQRRPKSSSALTTQLWKVGVPRPLSSVSARFVQQPRIFYSLSVSIFCRYLGQLTQRRRVCYARAQWRQQTEGERKKTLKKTLRNEPDLRCKKPVSLFSSQGDVILQSEHVIETLTKIAICADKINSININQGRWGANDRLTHAKTKLSCSCPTVIVFFSQHKVYSGSGERGDHRLHSWIGTTGGQDQEWASVCGEATKSS